MTSRQSMLAVFFFTALLLSSGAFSPFWTDTAAHDVQEGGPALQAVWSGIYVIVAVLLLLRNRCWLRLAIANWPLLLLLAICSASVLWSANPAVTLRKSVAICGTTLLGVSFALEFDLRAQLRILAAVTACAALASAMATLFFPSFLPATELAGVAWHGVFSHKNLLGRTMSLGVLVFVCLLQRGSTARALPILGILTSFTLVGLAHSQTALVVTSAILLLSLGTVVLRLRWREGLAVALLACTLAFPVVAFAYVHSQQTMDWLGRDVTLTGRSQIWNLAAEQLFLHPWRGHGYGAFWWIEPSSLQIAAVLGYDTPNAHNAFLDLGLQLGVLGVAAFVVGWLISLYRAIRCLRPTPSIQNAWPVLFLVFLLLYSFTESSLLAPNSLLWILYSALCVTITRTKTLTNPAS